MATSLHKQLVGWHPVPTLVDWFGANTHIYSCRIYPTHAASRRRNCRLLWTKVRCCHETRGMCTPFFPVDNVFLIPCSLFALPAMLG